MDQSSTKTEILAKYVVENSKEGVLGQGSFCIVRRGKDKETGKEVAVKVYRPNDKVEKERAKQLRKFKNQVNVMDDLSKPVDTRNVDKRLWCSKLEKVTVKDAFVQLVAWSNDDTGQPGIDPTTGTMIVVTEVAEFDMRSFLSERRKTKMLIPKRQRDEVARMFMTSVAVLAAKGWVHADLKPENVMKCGHLWKLIDMDGCQPIGKTVELATAGISFSPSYCCPEWAQAIVEEKPTIKVHPAWDAWSAAVTIGELLVLEPLFRAKFMNYRRMGASKQEATYLVMENCATKKQPPIPQILKEQEAQMVDMLRKGMLLPEQDKRQSIAEALDKHPYFNNPDAIDPYADASSGAASATAAMSISTGNNLKLFARGKATSAIYRGTLWKLGTDADPIVRADWRERVMWLDGNNGALCYMSKKTGKKLVLLDAVRVATAEIVPIKAEHSAFAFSFAVEAERGEGRELILATETAEEQQQWLNALQVVRDMDFMNPRTMFMDDDLQQQVKEAKRALGNRRAEIKNLDKEEFDVVLEETVYKLKFEADPTDETKWVPRKMWIAKNGSLCYYSKKAGGKPLQYYDASDLANAEFRTSQNNCLKDAPAVFEVVRPAEKNGTEYPEGIFAVATNESQEMWVKVLKRVKERYRIRQMAEMDEG